ncbi:g12468 [Coccomyxa viridis]|uniref:G12468 protein n=1 Tax=Coccomyxa viridis TaxID=1274662 RepID=A0ABP1GAE8_9CHLO
MRFFRYSKTVADIEKNAFHGWIWGPRVVPPPHPLVEQWREDRRKMAAMEKEEHELKQCRDQLSRMIQVLKDSKEVKHHVKQELPKVAQATKELSMFLDRLEAEPQDASRPAPIDLSAQRPAPISTSPAALPLEAKELPGGPESPTTTLQGPSPYGLTDSCSPMIGA